MTFAPVSVCGALHKLIDFLFFSSNNILKKVGCKQKLSSCYLIFPQLPVSNISHLSKRTGKGKQHRHNQEVALLQKSDVFLWRRFRHGVSIIMI